jgi:hypothetical protein
MTLQPREAPGNERPRTRRPRDVVSRRSLLGGVAVAGTTVLAGGSLLRIPVFAEEIETPENVRVSGDEFTLHAETNLAVNPRDPNNLLGVCMVSAGTENLLATFASFDGGASWQSNGELAGSVGGRDPSVGFDAAGCGFVCGNAGAVSVWRTDDGGRSFGEPVAITTGHADHPWLVVDRSNGASSGYLYVAFSAGTPNLTELGFSRSTDGGRSFEPSRPVATLPENVVASPMVAAGPDGAVYAIFGVWPFPESKTDSTKSKASAKQHREIVAPIRVVCSTDRGVTFGAPIDLGTGTMEIELSGDVNGTALPAIAADWRRGTVYAAFVTRQPGDNSSDVVIVASSDRGQTWNAPAQVNADAGQVLHLQPQIAVDEAGRVAISALALEEDRVDVVLYVSEAGARRFGPSVRVTSQLFDPARGTPGGGGKHGASDAFYPFWNDTRTGRLEVFTAVVR